MIVLRLLAVFIFPVLLTGCLIDDLKIDIKALKAYAKAHRAPNECPEPGVAHSRICYYKLDIKSFDATTGLFTGYVAKSVVTLGKAKCEKAKTDILALAKTKEGARYKNRLEDQLEDYPCLDPNPAAPQYSYNYVKYAFKIHGGTASLVRDDVDLLNVPYKDYLVEGKP